MILNDDRWYTKPAPLFLPKGHEIGHHPGENWIVATAQTHLKPRESLHGRYGRYGPKALSFHAQTCQDVRDILRKLGGAVELIHGFHSA